MNILVVGLGSMGKRRIRLLQRFNKVSSVIGVDGREDRRKEVNEQFGIDVFIDIEDALTAHQCVNIAFVCTSPLSHNLIISKLLDYGLHIFSEINLVNDGYKSNIKKAKEKNLTLFLSSTFLYREEIQYIRNHIKGRKNLNYVYHVGQYLPDWHPWESYNDFFISDKRTNGCREIMAIELPWITTTFGDVRSINVLSDKMTGLDINYKDNYLIQLEHENGNKGIFVVDVVSPKAVRNLEVYGENLYYSWNGSPDSIEEYNTNSKIVEKVKLGNESEHIAGYSSFIIENAYQNEIKNFFEVLAGNGTPLYGFEQDYEVIELIGVIENQNQYRKGY